MATSMTALINLMKRDIFSGTKKKALKPLITILVLWVLEKILENSKYYNCPKEGYRLYGGMFLFGPGLCLTMLTLVISNSFWDSVTSFFRGKFDRVVVCRNTCHALIKSALVGLMWFVLAFATTDYFVCFRLGSSPENSSKSSEVQKQSSLLAWCMLIIAIVLAFAYNAIDKCCFSHSRESTSTCLRDYERIEAEAAVSTFKKEAKVLAKQEGERQVMAILDEVKEGKSTLEVVEKAKQWIIARYSRYNAFKIQKGYQVNNLRLEDIKVDNSTNVEESTVY